MFIISIQIKSEIKRSFLEYYINNHSTSTHEWILNIILTKRENFDKVHFVEDVSSCPFGLYIRKKEKDFIGNIILYKKESIIRKISSIADIIEEFEGDIYIEMNFPKNRKDFLYLNVLENNPHSSKEKRKQREFQETTNELLEYTKILYEKIILERQVDEALSKREEEKFYLAANELNKINQAIKERH